MPNANADVLVSTSSSVPSVILASASPRRLALLQQIGVAAEVDPADIDETVMSDESADAYVLRLAVEKSRAVSQRHGSDRLVLGADTTIEFDGEIIGKPHDLQECRSILGRLSGGCHSVITGVALTNGHRVVTSVCHTQIFFRAISGAEIDAYWRAGEPVGKAGSYAIQGMGALFVSRLEGSYSNVVGLPVYESATLFEQLGVPILSLFDSSHGARA